MPLPVVLPGFKAAKYYGGVELGATDWFVIEQARVDRFGQATGADDWIYCDPERATRESPFKGPVVQGHLLLSLAPDLLPRLVVLVGWKTAVNAGVEECSFPQPAPVGARINNRASALAMGRPQSLPSTSRVFASASSAALQPRFPRPLVFLSRVRSAAASTSRRSAATSSTTTVVSSSKHNACAAAACRTTPPPSSSNTTTAPEN